MISQIYRKIKRKIQIKIVSIICVISMLNMDYHCVAFNNKTETLYPSQRSKIKQTDQQNGNPANVLHKPIVFIIEDGHCIPEIQLNISNTLFELRRAQNVSDIYVEGCSGDQDFDYLRLYPVAEKREKILSGYLKKGIISGVEYFAANTAAENSITVTGLEDMDIYRKNKATLEKISNYSAVTSLLNELNISIEKLTGSILQYSSVGLRRVLSEINISNVEESVGVLMFHNRFFKKAGIVRDYPQLCGYYKNIFELSGINFDEVIAESKKIPDNLDSLRITDELAKRIRARFTKLYISPIESDDIDKQIIDIICANKSYSNLRKFLIHNLAINSIDKTIVNNQMNSFLQSYLTSVAQNQKEKSRIKVYFALQTINKLLNLEFSYYDAMDINSGNLFSQIYIEAGKVSAGFAAEIRSLIDRLDPIVMESLKFYDLALKRDLTMQRKFIESYQKSKSPSVIVMGGFHLKSFMKYLEDNAIPFNLLSAKIGNISSLNRKIYIQHFMTTLNPIPNMVYNKSSLGAEPVLSLTGKTGPSGIWFNEVIGKHADALKHDKVKASIWIKALNANLVKTKNKIANVILVTSLAAMLGLTALSSPSYAQQPVSQAIAHATQAQNPNYTVNPQITVSSATSSVTASVTPQSAQGTPLPSVAPLSFYDQMKLKISNIIKSIRKELNNYNYVIDKFKKYGFYVIGFLFIAPFLYSMITNLLYKIYLKQIKNEGNSKKSSFKYDLKTVDSINYIKKFIELNNNRIDEFELATLSRSLKTLDEKLFRIVDLDMLTKVFEKLYIIANDSALNVKIRNQAVSVFTHYQLILKKERKKYESQLSEEKLQLRLFKEKTSFTQLIKYIFLYPAIQSSTIEKIDQVFDIDKDMEVLRGFNKTIRIQKWIQFLATIGFFGFVLWFTPMPNTQIAVFFLLFLSTVKTFEIILFYKLQSTTEKVSKWFELNLGRVANFERHLSGRANKFASYIASGEISRWYILSIMLNLLGAGLAVSCMNVVLLVPYLATFFFALFLSRLMLDPEFSKIKSSHYSMLINIMTKITIPAIGLMFGSLIQSFVISNLLEVLIILGSGDFIKTLSDSSVFTREVDNILNRLISEGHIVTQKTWKSSNKPKTIGKSNIVKYEFNGITSGILNESGMPIIDNIKFSIAKGEMMYISSSSGTGKSVFARLITFHLNNKKGEVILSTSKGDQIEVNPDNVSHAELRDIFRYLPFDNIPIGLSVEYILEKNQLQITDFVKFLKPLFSEFEEDDCKISIGKFNFSQQKRILLGLFLFINKPSFVVLDEPFLGIDEGSVSLMIEFIENYTKQYNSSVIVIDDEISASICSFFKHQYSFSAGKLFPLEKRIEYKEWLNKKINNVSVQPVTSSERKAPNLQSLPDNAQTGKATSLSGKSSKSNAVDLTIDADYISPEETQIKPDKTKVDMDFIKLARQVVRQKNESKKQVEINKLILFIVDIIDKIEIFGQEDTPHKMVLMMNYLSSPEDSPATAANVISEILKTAEYQFSGCKETDHIYADLSEYILNKNFLIGLVANAVKSSPRLSYVYADALKYATEDQIVKLVDNELKKRREKVISDIANNITDKSVLDFIRESKLSVYEISQIVSLFRQYNIDFVFLPYVLLNFNLISFRNWLFMANDWGIPVNSTTLMLDTAEKIMRWAKINEIKRKIDDIAVENERQYFKKTKNVGLNYHLLDNAA